MQTTSTTPQSIDLTALVELADPASDLVDRIDVGDVTAYPAAEALLDRYDVLVAERTGWLDDPHASDALGCALDAVVPAVGRLSAKVDARRAEQQQSALREVRAELAFSLAQRADVVPDLLADVVLARVDELIDGTVA